MASDQASGGTPWSVLSNESDLPGMCLWVSSPVLRQTSYQASASTMATFRAAEGIVAVEQDLQLGAIVVHSRPWLRYGSADLCSGGWLRANLLVRWRGPGGTNLSNSPVPAFASTSKCMP